MGQRFFASTTTSSAPCARASFAAAIASAPSSDNIFSAETNPRYLAIFHQLSAFQNKPLFLPSERIRRRNRRERFISPTDTIRHAHILAITDHNAVVHLLHLFGVSVGYFRRKRQNKRPCFSDFLRCLREDISLIVRIRYRTQDGDSMTQFTHRHSHLKDLLPHTEQQRTQRQRKSPVVGFFTMFIEIGHGVEDCNAHNRLIFDLGQLLHAQKCRTNLFCRFCKMHEEIVLLIAVNPQILLDCFKRHKHRTTSLLLPHISQSALHLECLHGFLKNEFAVHTLLHNVADHAVARKQLLEFLQRAGAAIPDVVVGVISERDDGLARLDSGHIRRGVHRIAEQTVWFTHLIRRLPEIRPIRVLELTDACKRLIVDDECRILAVGTLETVDERHEFVRLEVCRRRGDGGLCRGKKSLGLMSPVAIEERILLCVAESLAELLDEVVLKVEGVIVEKFLRHLDRNVEFVRVEDDLIEGRIAEGERRAFLNPRCRRFRGGDVDLMLAARGDGRCKRTKHVLLIQNVDQTLIVFLGNEIAAVCIHAFLQDILHLTEVCAKSLEHRGTIRLARASCLFRIERCARSVGDCRRHGLCKLRVENRLTLHALDVLAECKHLVLHLLVCLGVLCRKAAILLVFIEELLCLFPHFCTLFAHCHDLIHVLVPPLIP
nr:MAG TPA: hypothetical protein [Caudoviricetes sp.]